jgi:O-antigen/teichoic acid export membrane protein
MGIVRTIARNTVFSFIGTGTDAIITFVASIVLARGLGTEQYGVYSLVMWFLSLAALFLNLGLSEMPKRYIAEAIGHGNRAETHGFVKLTMVIRGVTGLVGCIVLIITARFWAGLFGNPDNQFYFILIGIALIPHSFFYAMQGVFGGFQRYDYSAITFLAASTPRLISIVILLALGFGVRQILFLHISILVLGVFIAFSFLKRLMPLKSIFQPLTLETATRNRAIKYALTMAGVIGINYLLYQQIEVFFIGLYCPVEQVGFYNLAVRLAMISNTLIPSAFSFVLLPAIAEQFGRGDIERIKAISRNSVRYLMMIALFLAAVQIALARPLITFLYGAEYAPSILLMQIVIVPFALGSIAQAISAVISGINEPGYILKTGVFLAVLSIGLDLWLIPRHGVTGAAIASSIPRFLCLPVYAFFAFRKTGVTWPFKDSIKVIIVAAITCLVLFILQSHTGTIVGLIAGIIAGVVLYTSGILGSRLISEQDLSMLRRAGNSVPSVLRNQYLAVIGLIEKIAAVGKKNGGN